ncbi:FAD-dependent oxidoreductase [Streptomyces sp. NRRL S-813]|uniref:FAD-dependent oxidoreductase n=1 Tax=Streptomyces sp. NRRL S-813 TaxID=1463919 RepID=UPI0004C14ED6|nr:FAD-dependent oxidoreductase [Streptomyces sp. NRRL S-813]
MKPPNPFELLAAGARVIVVGGGVLALSTAYALFRSGLEPTVVTADTVAAGATSSNGGLLVPADSLVWPGPANARAVPSALLRRSSANIGVRLSSPAVIGWGLKFLAHSTASQHARLSTRALELSRHSLDILEQWTAQEHLSFDFQRNGMTFLFSGASPTEERSGALAARSHLADAGMRYEVLDAVQLSALAPGCEGIDGRTVALFSPDAGHGDASAFTRALAQVLQRRGVAIHEHSPVERLVVRDGRVRAVATRSDVLEADAVVLAAGHHTRALARTAGLRVPILPVKGYAATVPIVEPSGVPDVGGVLETRHVAFSRTATHLRLSTGAEVGASDAHVPDAVRNYLRAAGQALFPQAADWAAARYEAGHRPMTPHGLPFVGPTALPGLSLNSGHGSLGWTQAAGSADLLAHLLAGTEPPLRPLLTPPSRP